MIIPWLVSLAAVAPAQERPWVEIASAPGWIAYVDPASIKPLRDGVIPELNFTGDVT